MLIPLDKLVRSMPYQLKGVLHIGAHECEEKDSYNQQGIPDDNIYWVEALPRLVNNMVEKYPTIHIYQGLIHEEDDKKVTFHITNNVQSSSILEFGSHAIHHPHVHLIGDVVMTTIRVDTLIEKHNIPVEKLNFINLDIQGVELSALKSMEKYLLQFDYIYTEVNTEQVYKGCCLVSELDEYLMPFGYKRVATKMCENFGWGDAFYIRYPVNY
jgi:FkbM family methyltransferase